MLRACLTSLSLCLVAAPAPAQNASDDRIKALEAEIERQKAER